MFFSALYSHSVLRNVFSVWRVAIVESEGEKKEQKVRYSYVATASADIRCNGGSFWLWEMGSSETPQHMPSGYSGFGEHAIRPRGPNFGPKASDAVGKEEGEEEQPEEVFIHPYPYTKPRHGMVDFWL
jgi:hypothetical protein